MGYEDSFPSAQYDKTDYPLRVQRAMKRPTGSWRDVMEELAKSQDKIDFSRMKNVRFGLGRRWRKKKRLGTIQH